MELNEFLEKFLPENIKDIVFGESNCSGDDLIDYFPEALQNFAYKLCEKQRNNCLDAWLNTVGSYYIPNNIKKAKQPKIEEL